MCVHLLPSRRKTLTEWEGERERDREGNINVKGTHRVAATCTTNQGRGQTATKLERSK
uniref:Thioredoxin domain containing 17 n=1 Tax=Molossus molossus TaxID=27622 RepID=A0A7J8D358_MOLMO|nr:thioredoxin domain containing 17 [Molossus molossus]